MNAINLTIYDMITATIELWDAIDRRRGVEVESVVRPSDCRVVRHDGGDGPYLAVIDRETGRSSEEAGDAGRWHLDGMAF